MGHANGNITTPVNTDDISSTIGSGSHDVGTLCSAKGSINKWSLWKPYRCAGLTSPTNLAVAQMKFGIDVSTARCTALENAIKSASNTQPAPANINASSTAYQYLPPIGGENSPYRMTDYADNPDTSAPAGLQFNRNYDAGACAPDEWHDWRMTETLLKSLSEKTFPSIPGSTEWTLPENDKGIKYQDCNLKLGPRTQEVIGFRPSNAMPLSYIFGDNRITSEKWRMGVAVYLPKGISTNNNPRWMLFAGNQLMAVANGGGALPFTGSNVELCQALYYNFKTHGIKEFTFIPCILLNCSLNGTAISSTTYTTRVELVASYNPQILLPPTMSRCTLTIDPNPVPGQVEQYFDSSYRGCYSTNLVAGTYKIIKSLVSGTGSNTTTTQKYYKVTIPSGTTIKIEHVTSGYGNTGNLKVTASGANVSVNEYANFANYKSNTVTDAVQRVTPASAALTYFAAYVGTSAPSSVSVTLTVTKI